MLAGGIVAGCAESHVVSRDASGDPGDGALADAPYSARDAPGELSDAADAASDGTGTSDGRVLRWGYADFLDAFVFEPGIVLVHADGAELVARTGADLTQWDASGPVTTWWGSDDRVVLGIDSGSSRTGLVVVLSADLHEVARYEVPSPLYAVHLFGDWLLVSADRGVYLRRLGQPDLDRFVEFVTHRASVLAATAGGEFFGERMATDRGLLPAHYFGAALSMPDAIESIGRAETGVDPPSYPPTAMAFSGPVATSLVVGNGDVYPVDLEACRARRTADCVRYAGNRAPRGHLAMGSARSGATSTLFALSTGLPLLVPGATFCDPADIPPVLGGARCRLSRIDPDVDTPVWSVDWNRPVVAVPAVEHDPWGNALVVATYAEWAAPGAPRGWAVEIVDLPAP